MSFVSTGFNPRVFETRNVLRQQRGLDPLFGTEQQRFAQTRAARSGRGFRNRTRKLRGWTTHPSRLLNPAPPTGEELLPGEINVNVDVGAAAAAGEAAEAAGRAAEAAGEAAEAAGEAAEAAANAAAGEAAKGGRRPRRQRSTRGRKTRRKSTRRRASR